MKWVKRGIVIVLLAVFLFSAGTIGVTLYQYRLGDNYYAQAAEQFLQVEAGNASASAAAEGQAPLELAPFTVDFASLQAENPDIVGWVYCEGTPVNYPVLQGATNDTYLRHLYDGSYCRSGSIFVEAENARDFSDYNTIIYGHNMMNEAMFGTLDQWAEQAYYEAHPVFWLLTPERDYRIDILGAYTTNSYSDTYQIFDEAGTALEAYLDAALAQSEIAAKATREEGSRYVVLSTCSYVFSNARFVIHGKLVPVDSAGGVPRAKNEP